MKQTLSLEIKKPQYVVTTDIAFAQTDSWYGHCRRDLKLDLIYVSNYSILMDIHLIFLTLKIIFIKDSTEGV